MFKQISAFLSAAMRGKTKRGRSETYPSNNNIVIVHMGVALTSAAVAVAVVPRAGERGEGGQLRRLWCWRWMRGSGDGGCLGALGSGIWTTTVIITKSYVSLSGFLCAILSTKIPMVNSMKAGSGLGEGHRW